MEAKIKNILVKNWRLKYKVLSMGKPNSEDVLIGSKGFLMRAGCGVHRWRILEMFFVIIFKACSR